jgi:methylmalonyl-CoA epimerase
LRSQDTIDAIMRILRIRHLTLAVRDLDAARASFVSLFGAEAADALAIEAFGARTQDLALGESTLQLVSPVDRDGALQRFIERRGEGVYTVALEVDDLDAAVAELAAKGVRVSDPVDVEPGLRTAFVTALATHGMSVQLIESAGAATEDLTPPPSPPLDLTPDEWSDLE